MRKDLRKPVILGSVNNTSSPRGLEPEFQPFVKNMFPTQIGEYQTRKGCKYVSTSGGEFTESATAVTQKTIYDETNPTLVLPKSNIGIRQVLAHKYIERTGEILMVIDSWQVLSSDMTMTISWASGTGVGSLTPLDPYNFAILYKTAGGFLLGSATTDGVANASGAIDVTITGTLGDNIQYALLCHKAFSARYNGYEYVPIRVINQAQTFTIVDLDPITYGGKDVASFVDYAQVAARNIHTFPEFVTGSSKSTTTVGYCQPKSFFGINGKTAIYKWDPDDEIPTEEPLIIRPAHAVDFYASTVDLEADLPYVFGHPMPTSYEQTNFSIESNYNSEIIVTKQKYPAPFLAMDGDSLGDKTSVTNMPGKTVVYTDKLRLFIGPEASYAAVFSKASYAVGGINYTHITVSGSYTFVPGQYVFVTDEHFVAGDTMPGVTMNAMYKVLVGGSASCVIDAAWNAGAIVGALFLFYQGSYFGPPAADKACIYRARLLLCGNPAAPNRFYHTTQFSEAGLFAGGEGVVDNPFAVYDYPTQAMIFFDGQDSIEDMDTSPITCMKTVSRAGNVADITQLLYLSRGANYYLVTGDWTDVAQSTSANSHGDGFSVNRFGTASADGPDSAIWSPNGFCMVNGEGVMAITSESSSQRISHKVTNAISAASTNVKRNITRALSSGKNLLKVSTGFNIRFGIARTIADVDTATFDVDDATGLYVGQFVEFGDGFKESRLCVIKSISGVTIALKSYDLGTDADLTGAVLGGTVYFSDGITYEQYWCDMRTSLWYGPYVYDIACIATPWMPKISSYNLNGERHDLINIGKDLAILDVGYTDLGSTIVQEFISQEYDMGFPQLYKAFTNVGIGIEPISTDGTEQTTTVMVQVIGDTGLDASNIESDTATEDAEYDATDPQSWTGRRYMYSKMFFTRPLIGRTGRFVLVHNQNDRAIKLVQVDIHYKVKKRGML